MSRRNNRAYTLIESLAVFTIISLLLALSMAALHRSRLKSHQSACLNNLHQVQLSLAVYLQENDETVPTMNAWKHWKRAYPQLSGCPSVDITKFDAQSPAVRNGLPGYAYNGGLVRGAPAKPIQISEVLYPATTVFFCDEAPGEWLAISPDPNEFLTPYSYGQEQGWMRHFGGENYLLADGHARWHTYEQVDGCNSSVGNTGRKASFCFEGPQPMPDHADGSPL